MTAVRLGVTALNLGARLAGFRSAFGAASAAAQRIPQPVWEAIAVVGYALALLALHSHQVAAHDAALVKATIVKRDGQWRQQLAGEHKAAIAWKHQADAAFQKIAQQQRTITDEQTARIDADARALRMRGPGKAAAPAGCRPVDHPGLAGIAGRPIAQPGPAPDAGTSMPAENGQDSWAVVPWHWLVDVVQERDAFRVEALGWRGFNASFGAEWERRRQQLLDITAKKGPNMGK